jgi:hypothetical protein
MGLLLMVTVHRTNEQTGLMKQLAWLVIGIAARYRISTGKGQVPYGKRIFFLRSCPKTKSLSPGATSFEALMGWTAIRI